MSNFEAITNKLEQFIKKYYTNELIKGAILFFTIGVLYFLFTLFIEYMLWLSPQARTVLFWVFVMVELLLFTKLIAFPLLHLFKLRHGINYERASKLIGAHFPEVNDKLLNVLQLNQNPEQSDLLIASIEQKSFELKPIPFSSAINFKSNTKYLKYAAVPVAILLISWITGKIDWFNDSYERVINYQSAYEPPAPFQFFVKNDQLQAIEGKDFILKVATVGDLIPENAKISFNNQTFYLQSTGQGEFQYSFKLPKESIDFILAANDVRSKVYSLEIVNTPNLINLELVLDYPLYTNRQDELLKSTGSAVVPEGTIVTWRATAKATTDMRIYSQDTLIFKHERAGMFETTKQLFRNFDYTIATSNEELIDYENLGYSIDIIRDAYPELNIEVRRDTIDQKSLYFYGQASDDYGLSKLQMVYHPVDQSSKAITIPIVISTTNFTEFVSAFPDQLNLEEGVNYQLYFEAYDNDAIHSFKRTKSSVFSYRKLTKDETEQIQLQEQNKTINDINSTFQKLQEQDQKLEEFSKTQKEKDKLNFNDRKKFEDFLKRQKQQEQLMKNFNKKLQNNLEEFQKDDQRKDVFKEELKERLKDNEAQLKKDEKLLEELEKFKDKINKEEFTQKLEELAKQNKNKKRSMKQLLELTKRYYITKKAEKISKELDALSQKQNGLSEEAKKDNGERQEELIGEFKKLQLDIEELKSEDRQLQKPLNIPRDEFLESEVEFDQQEALEQLKEVDKQNSSNNTTDANKAQEQARKRQKQAAQKIKELSKMMEQAALSGGGGGEQTAEDIEMLRQILENLLLFSFDQESLMNTFERIDIDNNKYGAYIIEQNNLREHFEHIDDSLFALSLRQPKLSEKVNSQITNVYFNIDKSLELLTENRLYQGVAAQQYAITASNELASFLSDALDNMEESLNPSPGSGPGEQLPDIIKSQEDIRKEAEEAMKNNTEGGKDDEGKEGEGDNNGDEGKQGQKGEDGDKGEQGKQGQKGNQGDGGDKGKAGKQGDEGQNGKDGQQDSSGTENGNAKGNKGRNGKQGSKKESNDGYGQGGREEQNAELFKIYQKQQQLRQALQDKLTKDGSIQSAGELIKQMEDVELDLLNNGITNQSLQKMMEVQHQLLKLEDATFMQGEDSKRQSKTNDKDYKNAEGSQIPIAKRYFNTTEILNRQVLPIQNHLKKKIQYYFKKQGVNKK